MRQLFVSLGLLFSISVFLITGERTRNPPVDLEILLLFLLAQLLVQPINDLFVRTALERDRFALVVETQIEKQDNFNAASASLFDGAYDRAGIQRWCLTMAI